MPKIVGIEDTRPKLRLGSYRDVTSPYDDKLYNTNTLYNKDLAYTDAVSIGIYPKVLVVDEALPKLLHVEGGDETYFIITEAGMPIGLLLTLTYPDRIAKYMGWSVQYEANELPADATPAWTKSRGATTEEISPAGYLHIVSSDEGLIYEIQTDISDATGATIEAKLKVITGQARDYPGDNNNSYCSLVIATGEAGDNAAELQIYSDGIVLWEAGDYYNMDTTDDYHVYRMTIGNGEVNVYVDGVLRMTTATYFHMATNRFRFKPEEMGTEGMENSWDYVYCRNDGVITPPN